ncbi:hypothetical protein [Tardiphaga sp. 367_B4_N1_1]|uniref:hypothetical protein n=1 Tax=Tardiphaga sp. 367_B4_N1_1 TaxID=3240777 RepID=UPI003F20B0B9
MRTAWIATSLVTAATLIFSIANLTWTVREGVSPLSANSEFFAYSWVYAVRWAHGERHVFQPHSQMLFAIYGLIDWLFAMTSGGAVRIISGWRTIALLWPNLIVIASVALIVGTTDRRNPVLDTLICLGLYIVVVQLSLSDQALNSLAYHSLAVPVGLGALPLWAHYRTEDSKPTRFYVGLCAYTVVCALSKPTFLAFALPFYVMEMVRAFSLRDARLALRTILCGALGLAIFVFLLYLIARNFEGLRYQLDKTYEFMRGQANWYDSVKGATPFHWYKNYVIDVMGWLPSTLIITILLLAALTKRADIIAGTCVGLLASMFCLYNRSQLHGEPEFLTMLLATTIGIFRLSGLPRLTLIAPQRVITPVAVTASVALSLWTFVAPPKPKLAGFASFMSDFDKASIPILFGAAGTRTLALQIYPVVFYGVADAWCRGSSDIFGGKQSRLLDAAVGTFACMHGMTDSKVDLDSFDRVVFPKEKIKSLDDTRRSMAPAFGDVMQRLRSCETLDGNNPTFDIVACGIAARQ